MDIKNSASKDYLAEIWKTNLKETIKATAPDILRSRKRGKRAGIRVRHSTCNSKVPLPAIVLTNAQSVLRKLDELHGLLQTKRLLNQSQLICVTESWLKPEICNTRTHLKGYDQFRNDRTLENLKVAGY